MPGAEALARLALESWIDGCLGEGAAAARAERAAFLATDETARAVQARIASEEAQHAELAWQVLAWALSQGKDPLREFIRSLRDQELVLAPDVPEGDFPQHWASLGRTPPGDLAPISARHKRGSRARLDRLLHQSA